MIRVIKLAFIFIFCAVCIHVHAQLTVSTALTPTQLVQDVLLGNGVTVTNVTYTGGAGSSGKFSTGNNPTNLGITEGIIMSTGWVNGNPAIGSSASLNANHAFNTGGDVNLQSLIPLYSIHDASVLQFDFVTVSDTIKFRYVFASEEYPEFVNSLYNDVFGFFVTGPNPLGGNYTSKNIALIPGTGVFVSIDNINNGTTNAGPCVNCAYYVNNSSGVSIVYDGFTKVLTAWCLVQPCAQYHIKLAVGDAGDSNYDSGVFLEANSFSASSVGVSTYYSSALSGNNAVEGCIDAIVSFKLSHPLTTNLTVPFTVSGTATNGTDYTTIPDSVTIPAGQDSVTLLIHPFADGITEGTETVTLIVRTSICGGYDTITINILDHQNMSLATSNDTSMCAGFPATVWAQLSGGIPPCSYTWSNGSNSYTTTVNPDSSMAYYVTATDSYGCPMVDSVYFYTLIPPTITVTANPNPACAGMPTTLTAGGAFLYFWNNGLNSGNPKVVSPIDTTIYIVTGTDVNGCTGLGQVTVDTHGPTVSISSGQDTICEGSSTILTASGAFLYLWSDSLGFGSHEMVSPVLTTTYSLTGTDVDGCAGTALYTLIVNPSFQAGILISSNPSGPMCAGTNVTFTAIPANGGIPGFQWFINGVPVAGATDSVYTTNSLANGDTIYCIMTSTLNCVNGSPATSDMILMQVIPFVQADVTITSDPPGIICPGTNVTFTATTVNGGTATYQWMNHGVAIPGATDSVYSSNTLADGDSIYCVMASGLSCVTGNPALSDTITVSVNDLPDAIINPAGPYCSDINTTTITAVHPGGVWSGTGITDSVSGIFSPAQAGSGTFMIYYDIAGNCSGPDTTVIIVNPAVSLTANAAAESCQGKHDGSIDLTISGGTSPFAISWSNSSTSEDISGLEPGSYNVTVIDTYDCPATGSYSVPPSEISCETPLYLPNIFTPNGDGKNDVLFVRGGGIKELDLSIYDRWGELVFFSNDQAMGWDGSYKGKPMDAAVYVYHLQVTFTDGTVVVKKGNVSLSR